MTSADAHYDRWYLKLLALYWGVFGIGASTYYFNRVIVSEFIMPWFSVFMTTSMTMGSITYFFKPRWGHHILLAMAIIVLLTKGPLSSASETESANLYWIIMTGILLLPMIRRHKVENRDYPQIRI